MRDLTVIFLLSLAMPIATSATIYKFYDENGNVVFADQPGPKAEVIEKRDIQTIKMPKVRQTTKLTTDQDKKAFSYDEFRISSPANDETIRENNGDINVDIAIKPQLKTKLKHQIVLLLDGKPVSEPGSATSFTLHNVDRGQHSLTARVIGKDGAAITTTDTVSVHLKRFSSLQPLPATGTTNPPGAAKPKAPSPPQPPRR